MLNKLKKILLCTIVFLITLVSFTDVYASETSDFSYGKIDSYVYTLVHSSGGGHNTTSNNSNQNNDSQNNNNCKYVFGDPNDDSTIAWMLQKFLNYAKIIGPLLVIVLSGFDFAKNALSPDADNMKKISKKLVTRLICAVGLYFVPLLTSFILNLINNTTGDQACGIQ